MKHILKGIIPPVVTPLLNNDELDVIGLKNLVNHLIDGGVHGLFLLGTNGEATSLSYKLRKELIIKACEFTNNRVPVLVGITDTSFNGTLDIADFAHNAGADAVVVAPPYYMPISQNEMVEYLRHVVSEIKLPVVLYNMPSCTKLHMTVETVKKAKELGVIGIKDSSGDMSYLYSLIEEFKDSSDFAILAGTELYLPDMIMNGGDGAVAGGANIAPRLFVDLYNASVNKDLDKIDKLRHNVIQLYNTIYKIGDSPMRITKGTKCALSVMGICNGYMALPLREFEGEERETVNKYVEDLKREGIL
ncbi:MAG: dihydrodipicolinate synthase family protein [Bacteroidota bacterium]